MTIATMEALRLALPGQILRFRLNTSGPDVTWSISLWRQGPFPPAASAAGSTNGIIPTSATTGALAFANPAGGSISEIARIEVSTKTDVRWAAELTLYDRLWFNDGLSVSSTTTQSFTMPALTRATSGVGVELWLDAVGSIPNATVITATYTNTAGTSGRTATCSLPSGVQPTRMFPFTLDAGDRGVTSVQSIISSVATGGTGYGLVLLRRVAEIPMVDTVGPMVVDGFALGFPRIENDACLALMFKATNAVTAGTIVGSINLIQG